MRRIFFISCIIIMYVISANAGEMYNCIDGNGNMVITNMPQDGMKCVIQKALGKEEQKSFKSTEPSINYQSNGSPSARSINYREEKPHPYNCVKICVQDNRDVRKACGGSPNEFHRCMTKNREQLNDCRQKCHEEERATASSYKNEENSTENFNKQKTSLSAVKFNLVDKRVSAEREGHPYPNSWFSYTMHGDRSLNVDRLSILKTKLIERFGMKLNGKTIQLAQFYVLETTAKPSFVKNASGKQVTNKGPYLPTLISEITMTLDGDYFHGSAYFPLKQGSKSTQSSLTMATTTAVDDLIKDMERRDWKP